MSSLAAEKGSWRPSRSDPQQHQPRPAGRGPPGSGPSATVSRPLAEPSLRATGYPGQRRVQWPAAGAVLPARALESRPAGVVELFLVLRPDWFCQDLGNCQDLTTPHGRAGRCSPGMFGSRKCPSRHECSGCMHGAGGEGRGQEAWEAAPSGCLSQGLSSRGRVQPEGPGRPKRPGGRAPGKAGSLVPAEVLRMEAPVSRCSRKEAPSERQPGWSPRCGDRSRWTCPPRSSGQRPGGGGWLPRSRETGLRDHPPASRPTFPAPAFTP